jgi:hypothetical protein
VSDDFARGIHIGVASSRWIAKSQHPAWLHPLHPPQVIPGDECQFPKLFFLVSFRLHHFSYFLQTRFTSLPAPPRKAHNQQRTLVVPGFMMFHIQLSYTPAKSNPVPVDMSFRIVRSSSLNIEGSWTKCFCFAKSNIAFQQRRQGGRRQVVHSIQRSRQERQGSGPETSPCNGTTALCRHSSENSKHRSRRINYSLHIFFILLHSRRDTIMGSPTATARTAYICSN